MNIKEIMELARITAREQIESYFKNFKQYYEENILDEDQWQNWALSDSSVILSLLEPYVQLTFGNGITVENREIILAEAIEQHNNIVVMTLGKSYEEAKIRWFRHIVALHPMKEDFPFQWIHENATI